MKKLNLIIYITVIIMVSACTNDNLYDFLLGPQPNFIDHQKLNPGLNIFGILRPDSVDGHPMSFVLVQKIVPAINETDSFSLEINDAFVMIYQLNNGSVNDSFPFNYDRNDSTNSKYRPSKFSPKAGDHFKIVCKAEELPDLTGETIIPGIPLIEYDTIYTESNKIRFSVLNDSSAAMYDIYLNTGSNTYTKRIIKAETGNTAVEIETGDNILLHAQLTIYVYDKNLAEYFTAANVFIKPNTYRPPFSMVENGYGCFGSMNILHRQL
jgi:hypothetical protein